MQNATPDKTLLEVEEQGMRIDLDDTKLNECRRALAQSNRRIMAFFSNPRLRNPTMMLNLTGDMHNIISMWNPFDYYMLPFVTLLAMKEAIEKYNPECFLYFGHSIDNSLIISPTAELPSGQLNATKFIELLEASKQNVKCVALFACSTSHMAKAISKKFPTAYVIFWETLTLDRGAYVFAKSFLEYIAKFGSHEYEDRIRGGFRAGYASFSNEYKVGDPLDKKAQWEAEMANAKSENRPPNPTMRPSDGIPSIILNEQPVSVPTVRQRLNFGRAEKAISHPQCLIQDMLRFYT